MYILMGPLKLEIEHYKEVQRKHLGKSVRMFSALPSLHHAIYKAKVDMSLASLLKT